MYVSALGFFHMQSSSERDDYVLIDWDSIQENKKDNFKKYSNSIVTDFNVTYDYESVLHYSAYAFSKNGSPTIIPLVNLQPFAKLISIVLLYNFLHFILNRTAAISM